MADLSWAEDRVSPALCPSGPCGDCEPGIGCYYARTAVVALADELGRPGELQRLRKLVRDHLRGVGPYNLGRWADRIDHVDPCDCDEDDETAGERCMDNSDWSYGVFDDNASTGPHLVVKLPRHLPESCDKHDTEPLFTVTCCDHAVAGRPGGELAELRAENERLKMFIKEYKEVARGEEEVLMASLKRYGRHEQNCGKGIQQTWPWLSEVPESERLACSCGLDALLGERP